MTSAMEMDFELEICDFVDQMTTETCTWTLISEYGLFHKAIIMFYIARQPYISCNVFIYCLIISICIFQHVCFTCSSISHDQLTPLHVHSILLTITGFSSLPAHVYYTRINTRRQFIDKIYLPHNCSTCLIIVLPGSTCMLFRVYCECNRIFWFTCIDFLNIPVRCFKLTYFIPGRFITENYSEWSISYRCHCDLRYRSAVSVGKSRVVTETICGDGLVLSEVYLCTCSFEQEWI